MLMSKNETLPEKHNNFTIALSTRKRDWQGCAAIQSGGGNGYEEVKGGISMATMEVRILRKWMEGNRNPAPFKEVSFLLFFSGLNASLRSVSFS